MPQFLGTRSNSRHISGSILGGSESQVIEKLARKSVHYWRNSGYKNISSWKQRAYQHTQRLLLSSTFAIPSVISLSYARKAKPYACTLILRSQEVDPRRTLAMIQEEEQAREYFKETKDILQLFCLCGWIDHFQKCVQDFIQEQLAEAANIMAAPGNEEEDCVRLHSLRRLVAGAVQEEELVRQPDHAAACAKLDRAIVWDGRGYVIKLVHHFSALTHLPRINLRKFRQHYGW